MIARGVKPVGWVAAVAGAALGCYMLSLNVAAERAELARIERQIIVAKQDIRSLQTELGTRGRLAQLEQWNAEVLALSAPNAAQFLDNEVVLARFETKVPTIEDRAKVQMASSVAPSSRPAPRLAPADYAAAAQATAREPKPLVHRASYVTPVRAPSVQKAALVKLDRSSAKTGAQTRAPDWAPAFAGDQKVARPRQGLASVALKPAAVKKAAEPKPIKSAEVKTPTPVKKAKTAPASSTGMLGDSLLRELGEVARTEQSAVGAR
jgi:hypothetical protein